MTYVNKIRKDIIVATDIDGCIRSFISSLEKTYDKYYPNNNRQPVTGWNLSLFFPIKKEIWEFIYKHHSEEIFMNALPYKGMINFMHWLNKRFTVHIITAQPDPKSEKYAKQWLIKNNIDFESFYCTFQKESLSYDIIIEDSPIMIPRIKKEGKKVIRIVRPWNDPVEGVPSVRNIKELKFKINELVKEM